MNKVIIKLLPMIIILGLAGCDVEKETTPEIIGGADEPTTIILESEPEENKADNPVSITGTWVTASMGYEYYGDIRTVDVTVRRIREKIEPNPSVPEFLATKRGIGYYFNGQENN